MRGSFDSENWGTCGHFVLAYLFEIEAAVARLKYQTLCGSFQWTAEVYVLPAMHVSDWMFSQSLTELTLIK